MILAFLLAGIHGSAFAFEHAYVEDFSTTEYRDASYTMAVWDTVAGEVRLAPFTITSLDTAVAVGSARDVHVAGNRAYVADYESGLHVVDVSDPTSPVLAGSYDTAGTARDVCVAGGLAYVADLGGGLQIIDVTSPTKPAQAGAYAAPVHARGVCLRGSTLFLANGNYGMEIVDVGDPSAPVLLGSCTELGTWYKVEVSGNHAYAATSQGLRWVDVADLALPVIEATVPLAEPALSLAFFGSRAVVAESGHIESLHLADSTWLGTAGKAYFGSVWSLVVAGDVVIGASGGNLEVRNITDVHNPSLVSSVPAYGVLRLGIDGTVVYGPTDTYLYSWDVSDAAAPVALDTLTVAGLERYAAPAVDGGRVYLARAGDYVYCLEGGRVRSIDVSDPATPTYYGGWTMLDHTFSAMAVSGRDLYVTGDDLLVQLRLTPRTVFSEFTRYLDANSAIAVSGDHVLISEGQDLALCETLNRYYDVESNQVTTISYDLPDQVTVDLNVYDVAGKLIKKLIAAQSTGAGRHEIAWNGHDETGRVVPAGVYFYRLDAGRYSETRRMALVK